MKHPGGFDAMFIAAAIVLVSPACDGSDVQDPGPVQPTPGTPAGGADGPPVNPQTPPIGQDALEVWLAEGHYKQWACEAEIFNRRLNGTHGRHRVCSNDLLRGSSGGPYPVGAASVKELFEGADLPNGYAVGLKVKDGPGHDTWYWYERTGRLSTFRPMADGIGVHACGPQCHALAPRDNVFITATGP